jgi:hypothetical protein
MASLREDEVNETTPLIASEAGQIDNSIENGHAEEQSLDPEVFPVAQIMLLCFARVAEPIAFFSIFPFINQMIQDATGIAETDVGFYSGLIVGASSSFYLFNQSFRKSFLFHSSEYFHHRSLFFLLLRCSL